MKQNLTFKSALTALADGTFTGLASTFANVDRVGDRVIPGAFKRDLQRRGSKRPLLWSHDPAQPIGFVELTETATGLRAKGTLILEVEKARELYALLKARVIDSMSIGYETVNARTARDGARELTEVDLWEVSLVTFPANERALVDGVKRAGRDETFRMREMLAAIRALKLSMRVHTLEQRINKGENR